MSHSLQVELTAELTRADEAALGYYVEATDFGLVTKRSALGRG